MKKGIALLETLTYSEQLIVKSVIRDNNRLLMENYYNVLCFLDKLLWFTKTKSQNVSICDIIEIYEKKPYNN